MAARGVQQVPGQQRAVRQMLIEDVNLLPVVRQQADNRESVHFDVAVLGECFKQVGVRTMTADTRKRWRQLAGEVGERSVGSGPGLVACNGEERSNKNCSVTAVEFVVPVMNALLRSLHGRSRNGRLGM